MPHEKITQGENQLVIGWNRIGWVQASIYPEGWTDTGDATHVALNPERLNLLMKTLRRAKRAAYSSRDRHFGFENEKGIISATPLFKDATI